MSTPCTLSHDERCINRMASTRGSTGTTTNNATAIRLDNREIPVDLIGGSHHFNDLPRQRRPIVAVQDNIPMEEMRRQVAINGLRQPTVRKYSGKRMRQSSHES